MAKLTITLPNSLALEIDRISANADQILSEALSEAAEAMTDQVVRPSLRKSIQNTSNRSTGELYNSLGVSPVKVDREGVYNVKVGFREPRSDGKANAMIANVLEYGSEDHHQPARPWLRPVKSKAQKVFALEFEKIYDQKVKR